MVTVLSACVYDAAPLRDGVDPAEPDSLVEAAEYLDVGHDTPVLQSLGRRETL